MTKFTKVKGNFKFRSGAAVEFNVYRNQEGSLLTRQRCGKCDGDKVFSHPSYQAYEAGGVKGGCFSCNARGYHAVRAYPA